MKVKFFNNENADELEVSVNDFISVSVHDIVEIKYQATYNKNYLYVEHSVMILYN